MEHETRIRPITDLLIAFLFGLAVGWIALSASVGRQQYELGRLEGMFEGWQKSRAGLAGPYVEMHTN